MEGKLHLSVREPKHAIFSRDEKSGLHVFGYFDQLEASYDKKLNRLNISFFEK